LNSVVEA
jgi:hypothetical protein